MNLISSPVIGFNFDLTIQKKIGSDSDQKPRIRNFATVKHIFNSVYGRSRIRIYVKPEHIAVTMCSTTRVEDPDLTSENNYFRIRPNEIQFSFLNNFGS